MLKIGSIKFRILGEMNLEEAGKQNAPLPTTAIVREFYRMAMIQGLGKQDFAAISQIFE